MSKHDHSHHAGLAADLAVMTVQRRQLLRLAAAAGVAAWAGCKSGGTMLEAAAGTGGSELSTGGSCDQIPEETAGPYPGDGSNGPNALALSGIVRSDIRSSIAGATGVGQGVPLTVKLELVDLGCAPLSGYAIYLWHCDREGRYSMYSAGAENENYLRGVQETDDTGIATFQTVFPGCYSGRWPHIHFEIYPALNAANASGNKVATSQLALPKAQCDLVYAESGYSASVGNLAALSLERDNVFSDDGAVQQLAGLTGSVAEGFVATLKLPIAL